MTDEELELVECRCPNGNRSRRHLEYHLLVIAQGGPAGLVNAETLRKARAPARHEVPPPEERARFRAQLVAAARRAGKHAVAERPPWAR